MKEPASHIVRIQATTLNCPNNETREKSITTVRGPQKSGFSRIDAGSSPERTQGRITAFIFLPIVLRSTSSSSLKVNMAQTKMMPCNLSLCRRYKSYRMGLSKSESSVSTSSIQPNPRLLSRLCIGPSDDLAKPSMLPVSDDVSKLNNNRT